MQYFDLSIFLLYIYLILDFLIANDEIFRLRFYVWECKNTVFK